MKNNLQLKSTGKLHIGFFYWVMFMALLGFPQPNACFAANPSDSSAKSFTYIPTNTIRQQWPYFEPAQASEFYALHIVGGDNLPFVLKEDSLFALKLTNGKYLLYYNSNMLRNSGIVIIGSLLTKQQYELDFGTIDHAEVLMIGQDYLLKITENVGGFPYDSPPGKQITYIALGPNLELLDNISILQKGNVLLDDSTNLLLDTHGKLLSEDSYQVSIKGTLNNKSVATNIVFANGKFVVPANWKNLLWSNANVVDQPKIRPHIIEK